MIEVRNFVGGMDKDSSLYDVAKGFYLDALNVTKDAISENNDLAATNVVGNRKIDYTYPAGRSKTIGSFGFQLRNTVIFFRWNANGYHGIYEGNISTRTITKIFVNLTDSADIDVLGFTENGKINSINIYPRDEGDLLFFLDSLGRPTGLDIAKFKAGAYTPVTRAILDKGKMPPLEPPQVVYDNDTTRRVNNTRNRLFRFKYRWIYDDFEKSTFSPISIVPLPVSILSDVFTNVITNNNVIRFVANTGGKNVKSIEIGMSFVEKSNDWPDFQSVVVIDKSTEGLGDDVDFPYAFYNDSAYPDIDVQESIELFDYVPDVANAQEMPNGNVLAYIGITEGYNKDTVEDATITVGTVAAGSGGSVGSLNAIITIDIAFDTRVVSTFSGIPATGTIINFKIKVKADSSIVTAGTYTTIAGDSSINVVGSLNAVLDDSPYIRDSAVRGGGFALATSFLTSLYEFSALEIIPPTTAADTNSIATWPWSTERNIARLYFDQKGKTNGILYTDKVTFPAYAENGSQQPLIPYINYKINDVPPSWAYSMQFAFTKDGTQWIVWETLSVNKSESAYIYLDVTSFVTNAAKKPTTAQVLSYTFQDGDRLRFWRDTSNTVYADTYDSAIEGLVVDPVINSIATTGTFLKIKNVAPFIAGISAALNYVIQIYRPTQQAANKDNQVYYELGRQYAILDPTLSTRRHAGEVTDQVVGSTPAEFNFYEGDAYFRSRTIAISEVGYATFNVMDRNFVDFYISAVSSVDGRPNIIDINAKRQYYGTLIRFGQAYQANTNINGLNRFYPNNFDEYDYNYGDATRLKVRDKYLKVFQKFKIGVVPLYSELTKDPNGNTVTVVTDKLLNPIQYRVGNFGLSAPESLASWHFADYGCDINKGVVWRDSNDGVYPISDLYKMSSWAAVELPLRTGDSKIYGVMSPKTNEYIMSLESYTVPIPHFTIEATLLNSITGTGWTVIGTTAYTIDWGDGTIDSFAAGTTHPTHTYGSPYTGEIKMYPVDFTLITSFTISGSVSPALNGLRVLTSELSKLSGLTNLSLNDSIYVDGIVNDLPRGLTYVQIRKTNLNGNVSELPTGLATIIITGSNTLAGNISDLPAMTYLDLEGLNTLTGDVADLPRNMVLFVVFGVNTVFGDLVDLPPTLTYTDVRGSNTITGDLANAPNGVFVVVGQNTIYGDIADIPSDITIFGIVGRTTITGDIVNLPAGLLFLEIGGKNTVVGDLLAAPPLLTYVGIESINCNISYTSGRTWANVMQRVIISSGANPLTSTEVDNLLIDLSAVPTWTTSPIVTPLINLAGFNGARTAASDAAVAILEAKPVLVETN